jgi:molybdopterin/thiamine biosynthesis adenylyltransferase
VLVGGQAVTRPRVKPEHHPYQLSGGRIRLGRSVYGIASEVEDPTGAVWTLLGAMDGTRTTDQVVAHVTAVHDGERPEAVRAAIDTFAAAGHVEDAAAPDPEVLTDRDKQRHDRSRLFYRWIDSTPRASWWEPQARLRGSRAVVVGVGGTGGHAALALAASGVGSLHCVDRDDVEFSNLNRQILFTESDVGRPKVDAAVERLRALNTDIAITGERCEITRDADLRALADQCDVLVLCADQPGEIRAWANRACLAAGTPWVDAGYHGPEVTATAFVPGQGACYECLWLRQHELQAAAGDEREYTVQRGGSNAVFAPTAGISGQLAAHLAIALLTGVVAVRSGVVSGLNLVSPDHHFIIEPPWRADCPACGGPP